MKKYSWKKLEISAMVEGLFLLRCNVDLATEIFTQRLTKMLDRMAPIKKIHIKSKSAAWLSEETNENIIERNEAQPKPLSVGLLRTGGSKSY